MELAGRLAALKAGQDIRLEDMMDLNYQDHLFKLRAKEEKLRELLGVINHARERCQAGVLDRCAECGMALTETLLDERPWEQWMRGRWCGRHRRSSLLRRGRPCERVVRIHRGEAVP